MRNFSLIAVIVIFATIQNIRVRGKMIFERAYFTQLNKSIIDGVIRIDKINKTSYALNANVSMLEDLPDSLVSFKVYAMFSNEYRPMPIRLQKNICDAFKNEYKWFHFKDSHLPKACPVKKDFYYIRNHLPNISKYPFDFLWEKVMVKISCLESGSKKIIFELELYSRIDNTEAIIRRG